MHEGKGSSNPHFPCLSECFLIIAALHRVTNNLLNLGQWQWYLFIYLEKDSIAYCNYCDKHKEL